MLAGKGVVPTHSTSISASIRNDWRPDLPRYPLENCHILWRNISLLTTLGAVSEDRVILRVARDGLIKR